MDRRHLVAVAVMGVGLCALPWSGTVSADKRDGEETCASKFPDAPTKPPRGYDHENEHAAYVAFRREARKAGYVSVKKVAREKVEDGPCVGRGEHLNMSGAPRASKGKKSVWRHIGSMTSCEICEETATGPRLTSTVWRIHPKF